MSGMFFDVCALFVCGLIFLIILVVVNDFLNGGL